MRFMISSGKRGKWNKIMLVNQDSAEPYWSLSKTYILSTLDDLIFSGTWTTDTQNFAFTFMRSLKEQYKWPDTRIYLSEITAEVDWGSRKWHKTIAMTTVRALTLPNHCQRLTFSRHWNVINHRSVNGRLCEASESLSRRFDIRLSRDGRVLLTDPFTKLNAFIFLFL